MWESCQAWSHANSIESAGTHFKNSFPHPLQAKSFHAANKPPRAPTAENCVEGDACQFRWAATTVLRSTSSPPSAPRGCLTPAAPSWRGARRAPSTGSSGTACRVSRRPCRGRLPGPALLRPAASRRRLSDSPHQFTAPGAIQLVLSSAPLAVCRPIGTIYRTAA
jgi:hypothetical protein